MWNQPTEDDELVWRELERMELIPLANKRFNELSSGQVQRTLIARALVQEAEILLLDEPTSNLDIRYQIEVMNMVRSIVKERGISACAIIHDINLAMRYCDRVLLMDDGRIVDFGETTDVLTVGSIRDVFGVETEIVERNGCMNVLYL